MAQMLHPRTELVISLVFMCLILTGLYMTSQIDLAFSSNLETISGPRAYPAMILGAMLLFNGLVIIRSIIRLVRETPDPSTTTKMFEHTTIYAAIVLVATAVFCFALEPVGYILTMIPLLFVTAMFNGARDWLRAALVSTVLAFVCLIIFRYGLNIVLPEGVLGIDGVL